MSGSNTYNDVGVYSGSNARPPSGNDYAYWQTTGSSLYLFGGWGTFSTGNSKSHFCSVIAELIRLTLQNSGHMNALWKYSVASNQWTWMSGYSSTGQSRNASIPHYRAAAGFALDDSHLWLTSLVGSSLVELQMMALLVRL
jgi:hypothetical protein